MAFVPKNARLEPRNSFVPKNATQQQEKSSGLPNFARGAVGGFVEGAGNIIQGIGQGLDYAGNLGNRITGQPEQKLFQDVTQPIQKYVTQPAANYFKNPQTGYDPNAFSGQAGNVVGQGGIQAAALALAPEVRIPEVGGFLGGILSKGKALMGTAREIPYAGPVIGATADIAGGAAKAIPGSALSTTASTVGSENRLPTREELISGALIDSAIGGVKNLIPTAFRFGLNPEARGKENFKEVEKRAQEAAGKYFGTKQMIVKQADNTISVAGKKLDNIVASSKGKWTVNDLTGGILDTATRLEGTNKPVSDAMINYATEIEKKYGNKTLTAKDILDIKRNVAETSSLFEGGMTDLGTAGRKQAADMIWENTDNIIDSIPGAKKLNRDMTVAYSVKNPASAQLKQQPSIGFFSKVNALPAVTPTATTLAAILKAGTSPVGKQAIKTAAVTPLSKKLNSISENSAVKGLSRAFGFGK